MYSQYWHIDTERTLSKLTLYVRKLRAWKHTASSTRLLFLEWPFNRFIDNGEDWFTPITTHVAESMPKRVTRTLTRAGVYLCKGEIGVRSCLTACLCRLLYTVPILYSVCVFRNTLVVYSIRGISMIRHRAGARLGNSDTIVFMSVMHTYACEWRNVVPAKILYRVIHISFFSLTANFFR